MRIRGTTTTEASQRPSPATFCPISLRDRHSRHLGLLPLVTWVEYSCTTLKKDCEYCDHGCRDVSLGRSDPKNRGLSAFPPIRRPAQRTSRRRQLEPFVTSYSALR